MEMIYNVKITGSVRDDSVKFATNFEISVYNGGSVAIVGEAMQKTIEMLREYSVSAPTPETTTTK